MMPIIIGIASNIRVGNNPPYGIADFAAMYPQFFKVPDEPEEYAPDESGGVTVLDAPADGSEEPVPIIPPAMMQVLIDLAHACVRHARFRDAWTFCMGLFLAHFVTLYLKTLAEPGASPYEIAKAGETGGLVASKSVDGVSVGYNFSVVANDLEGWAEWKATEFGEQFATFAKMFSLGGMYIH